MKPTNGEGSLKSKNETNYVKEMIKSKKQFMLVKPMMRRILLLNLQQYMTPHRQFLLK